MPSPAVPGLFFCFAAMVLLIFASVSVPIWDKVTFLNTTVGGKTVDFGVFGYTGSKHMLGYSFQQALGLTTDSKLGESVIHNLTYVLILHPIGAALSFIAVVFGLCGAGYSRIGTIMMTLAAVLALLVTLVAWVIDLALFSIVKHEITNNGGSASYGIANWFTIAAWVSLVLGFCAGLCGSFGRYRHYRGDEKI